MPDEGDQVLFPTIQTYDSGEVVRWIDQPTEDGTEPEHPAPALTLTEAQEDHHGNSGDEEEATGSDEQASGSDEGVTAETPQPKTTTAAPAPSASSASCWARSASSPPSTRC